MAHEQPKLGHRTGIEPVLLAAFVPARAGDSVLEGGTGSGAGLLCLTVRVADLRAVGVERDPEMAVLARPKHGGKTPPRRIPRSSPPTC